MWQLHPLPSTNIIVVVFFGNTGTEEVTSINTIIIIIIIIKFLIAVATLNTVGSRQYRGHLRAGNGRRERRRRRRRGFVEVGFDGRRNGVRGRMVNRGERKG